MIRYIGLAIALGAVLMAQQGPTPANPFPNHEPPPAGWFCIPADQAHSPEHDAHACSCLGMVNDPICGSSEEQEQRQESNRCKVWCHRDACTCRTQCEGS